MPQRPPFAAYNIGYDAVSWLEQELEPIMNSVQEAEVGEPGDEKQANEMRRSKVAWCHNDNVRNFLIRNFSTANRHFFGYDIRDVYDIQYSEYDASYKGHYDWHADSSANGTEHWYERKLSMSLQLSGPDDYEGGLLEIQNVKLEDQHREKGTVIVFPSSKLHRVTPVTSGKRKALVTWMEGPTPV